MQNPSSSSSFSASELTKYHRNSKHYELKVIQDPDECRALPVKGKARGAKWPLEPPPVIEFILHDNDPNRTYLHSPFWFCTASLETPRSNGNAQPIKGLVGTTVSSLHKVKLTDSKERGFFIFGDINVKITGECQLKFSLFEMRQGLNGSDHMVAEMLTSSYSKPFKVIPPKGHTPVRESTALSKQLCEAGIRLRIRKDTGGRRRTVNMDWGADSSRMLATGGLPVFADRPSLNMLAPPRSYGEFGGLSSAAAGIDIRDRLSVSNAGHLGIRQAVNQSSQGLTQPSQGLSHPSCYKPDGTMKGLTGWSTAQTNWSPATTFGHQHGAPTYTAAQPAPNFELRSGPPTYYDTPTTYQGASYAMPSSHAMNSGSQSTSDHSQLRGSDSSLLFDSGHYSQMPSSEGSNDAEQNDPGHVAHFDMPSFRPAAGMTNGRSDHNPYKYEPGSRTMPLASNDSVANHYG